MPANDAIADTDASLRATVRAVTDRHRDERGGLLPALHDLQAEVGYVPPAAIAMLADDFNLSRAEVFGVVTFYRDFRDRPPARCTVRVCVAEACQAVGSAATVEHIEGRLGVAMGGRASDDSVELGEVFCLGNCALGPSVEIDGAVHGRVDAGTFDTALGTTR